MSNSLLQWVLGGVFFEFAIGFVLQPELPLVPLPTSLHSIQLAGVQADLVCYSTAQARTQYSLATFRCDDVTSSSGNCKADGFYADPPR
jgi:hypothetical protein